MVPRESHKDVIGNEEIPRMNVYVGDFMVSE